MGQRVRGEITGAGVAARIFIAAVKAADPSPRTAGWRPCGSVRISISRLAFSSQLIDDHTVAKAAGGPSRRLEKPPVFIEQHSRDAETAITLPGVGDELFEFAFRRPRDSAALIRQTADPAGGIACNGSRMAPAFAPSPARFGTSGQDRWALLRGPLRQPGG